MLSKRIPSIVLIAVGGVFAACSSSREEDSASLEQHIDDPNKDMVCLRQDNKNPGHPNLDDYNRNKRDANWVKRWTNSLGNIMGGNAADCSKTVNHVITCVASDGKDVSVTLARHGKVTAKPDQAKKEVFEVLQATGSCRKSFCNDPSGMGFGGGQCEDPNFESPKRKLTSTIELSVTLTEELSMKIPGFGGAGITVEVGRKEGKGQETEYQCRGVLQEGVSACSALSKTGSMDCSIYQMRVPLWQTCRTEAVSSSQGSLRESDAAERYIGTANGYGLEKGEQKLKTACSGCATPGGAKANPDGTPFCETFGAKCLATDAGAPVTKATEAAQQQNDDLQKQIDDAKKRINDLKKKTGCLTPPAPTDAIVRSALAPATFGFAIDAGSPAPSLDGPIAVPLTDPGTTPVAQTCSLAMYFSLLDSFDEHVVSFGSPMSVPPGAFSNGAVLTVQTDDGLVAPFFIVTDPFTGSTVTTWVGERESYLATGFRAEGDGSIVVKFGMPSELAEGDGDEIRIGPAASVDQIISAFEMVRQGGVGEAGAMMYAVAAWAQHEGGVAEPLRATFARSTLETNLVRAGSTLTVGRR